MNFRDKIEEKIFEWGLATLGCVLAALGCLLGYLIRYKSKVDNLKTQVEELRGARDRLQHDVDSAIRNLMKIEEDVKRRLTESDDIIAVAEKILEDGNKGCYLNMMSRYQVSKRADKAASEAKNLKDEISKISSVGYRESTQVVETVTSNRGYEAFESRMPTITGVLEALKDHNITRIGIHGMGGVGKTMLVKEVLKQAEKEKLFDKYLFLVVSNDPDLKRIQREIAEQLGLESVKETELARRDQLRKRLKQENRVLIIMDDIWKYLDLEALGIFFEDDQKGCKLLLTSRLQSILRDFMDTQMQFSVGVLSDNEAISLFEKIVGDLAKTGEFKSNMHQIVKECAGLPIAITTVANALKNKKYIYVWKDALNKLKMSCPIKIEGMDEEVYKSIKLSYDFLESEAKSLLSLCSLHGEDYYIKVEDLLKYGVGLDLFHNVHKIEDARCRVHTLVDRLKDSCMLFDGYYNGTVKMHDVIRDVVIYIAAEEKHMFTIRTAIELQNLSKREDAVAISLPYIDDDLELPNQFECSKLELLLIFWQKVGFHIPDSFFEGLKDLKVLKLSECWSGVLPSSLSSLENLQTLCLGGNKVQNAIIIGELKNLKALSLSLYYIERLPKEIGQLTHLQFLDLRECSELKFIPPNVLSNLKRLEELYLPDHVEWEVEVQSTERTNAMVSELDHLSHLTKLHICIENAKILPKAMVFERLESYRIAIGCAWLWSETSETRRILKLKISFQSDYGYKVILRKCETLILGEMKGVKNILYELDLEGFQSLKHLKVQHNDEIQYIIKSMGVLDSVFPSLESITLWNVNNLERICYTRLPTESFCNLRVVEVRKCWKLEFLFSSSMVGCFSQLQKIYIEDCEIMSAIVAIEREEIEVNSDDNIMFKNLHSLKLKKLFKLKGFLYVVDSLVLFDGKVVFPNLEELEINGMDSMKMIWPNQLISDCFGKLGTMTISGCTNLASIFSLNMLRMLRNLKELTIYDCNSLEEVFEIQGTNNVEESSAIAAAELRSLNLRNLEKVNHVWSMDPQGIITFAKLRTIKIDGCSSLKSVFPTSVAKALTQLEVLEIRDCAMMEEIIAKEEGIETTTLFVFSKLTTLRLHNLPELKSFYPGKYILEWPLLNYLQIFKCDKLKIFGSNKSSIQETNGLAHHANLIQQPLFFIEKVVFPNLEKLEIKGMDSMKMIWRNQLILDCFGKLETMTVSGCTNLTNIAPPNMLRTLRNLKELEIYDCDSLEEVFEIQGTNNVEESSDIVAAELISLKLRNLSKVKHVWSMDPRGIITFAKLRTIQIEGYSSLKSVFPTSVAKALMQLEKLEIKDCATVEEIVAKEEGIETTTLFVFPQLTTLKLQNLPKLKTFYPGNHTSKWPSLMQLNILQCNQLKIIIVSKKSSVKETNGLGYHARLTLQPLFFVEKVVLSNLEELEITGMDCMKMIWLNQLISDSFGKLETLTLSGCTNLTNIVPHNMLRTLWNLKELKIYDCDSLEEVFEIQGTNNVEESSDIAAAELISLNLRNLEKVKHVWSMDPQGIVTFAKLQIIKIDGCSSLKSVFPTSVAKALMQLKELEIRDCATMEEIIAKEEGIETTTLFVFSKLTTLGLHNLPELKSFFRGKYISEWPLLNYLQIFKCDKLKIFGSNESSIQETNGLAHHANLFQQPLFFIEKVVFSNLEELEIKGMDSMKMIWPNQLISGSFGKLKTLTISGCTNLTNIVSYNILRTLWNLKELKIYDCDSLEEVFEIQGTINVEESSDIAAAELLSLNLRNLEKVKHVWSMDPKGIITFAKLHIITIDGCSSLKSVFPTSVAKALMQLKELEIRDCATMEEIIAKEEGIDTTTLFVFSKLSTLRFHNLPELKSFYRGKYILVWPLLNCLQIFKCDKLKIFGSNKSGIQETNGLAHHANLIQQPLFFIEKVVFSNLEELEIKGMDSMKMIWPNQLISGSFGKLKTLTISGCTNLTNIVSHNMLRMLRNLKELKIYDCDSLEEVFEIQGTNNVEESSDIAAAELISLNLRNLGKVKHVWSMDPQGTVTFAKLRTIKIDGCSSLKSVFPTSVAKALMQLKELEIRDCATVEEIIAKEEGIETTTLSVFSKLTILRLHNLPELKSFYRGKYISEWPLLNYLQIFKCDKLKIFGSNRSSIQETNGLAHHANLIQQPLFFIEKVVFSNLEELEIKGMDSMRMIWPNQLTSDSFGKLETLTISSCTNLTNIVPHNMLRTLRNLKDLKIYDCDSLEEVFEIQGTNNVEESSDIAAAKLISLNLRNLEKVKYVWSMDPEGIVTFAKLRTIKIDGCSSLKSVFPTSLAKALLQLEELEIRDCAMVEEIIAKEEGIETTTLSIFSKLTTLRLHNLPELKSFFRGKYISEWPLLNYLQIFKCDKLKIFGSNESSVQETNGLAHHANLFQQPLFFIEKDKFTNLERLELDDAMNETCGGLSAEFCCNLKELSLYGNFGLKNITYSFLHGLRMPDCQPFSSTAFHYLQTLVVLGSDVLISLLTPSTAKTLVQLNEIRIRECKRMTEIVANEGSEAEAGDEIAFNNLTSFEFDHLPSLTAFHLGNRTIKFPSLGFVRVKNCPKLKIFCSGVLSTPKLRRIWMEEKRILKKEGDGDLDLNATIGDL